MLQDIGHIEAKVAVLCHDYCFFCVYKLCRSLLIWTSPPDEKVNKGEPGILSSVQILTLLPNRPGIHGPKHNPEDTFSGKVSPNSRFMRDSVNHIPDLASDDLRKFIIKSFKMNFGTVIVADLKEMDTDLPGRSVQLIECLGGSNDGGLNVDGGHAIGGDDHGFNRVEGSARTREGGVPGWHQGVGLLVSRRRVGRSRRSRDLSLRKSYCGGMDVPGCSRKMYRSACEDCIWYFMAWG